MIGVSPDLLGHFIGAAGQVVSLIVFGLLDRYAKPKTLEASTSEYLSLVQETLKLRV